MNMNYNRTTTCACLYGVDLSLFVIIGGREETNYPLEITEECHVEITHQSHMKQATAAIRMGHVI